MYVYPEKDIQEERLDDIASLNELGMDMAKDIAKKQKLLDLVHDEKVRKINEYIGHDVDYVTLCRYAEISFKNSNQGNSSKNFRECLQNKFDNKLIGFNKVVQVGINNYTWEIYFDFISTKTTRQKHFALDVPISGKLTYENLKEQNDGMLTLFEVDSNNNLSAFTYSYKFEDIKKAFKEKVDKK